MYGPPAITRKASNEINPNSLEARLINFTFIFKKPSGVLEGEPDPIIKTQRLPRNFDNYRIKGIVGRIFGLRPFQLRLIWETGEWDPVAGDEAEEDEGEDGGTTIDGVHVDSVVKEKWARRDVELVDGTREVGFWIEGREARVRVELR